MTNLILTVYLIDLLNTISALTKILLVFIVPTTIAMYMFVLIETSNYSEKARNLIKITFSSKLFKSLWIISILGLFMPSKQSMYTMLGLHVGNNIVTEVAKSPIYNKAYKVLEKSLDDYLNKELNKCTNIMN